MDAARRQLLLPDDAPRGRGVRIAVIDTGVDATHPDLQGAVDLEASQVTDPLSKTLDDFCYHGTHMAGIIAGRGVLRDGQYRGVAPDAQLVVFKAKLGPEGFEGDAAKAVEAALDANVDIINYSNGHAPLKGAGAPWLWPEKSTIEDAFRMAADAGVLCVVAAGNHGPTPGSIERPGGLPCVLTVGAIGRSGEVLAVSARGPYRTSGTLRPNGARRFDALLDSSVDERRKPDVVAPGENIVAARARNGAHIVSGVLIDPTDGLCPYMQVSGTSPATAMVSGLSACLLQLARDNRVDLGPNPGAALLSMLRFAARPIANADTTDAGHGVVLWPMIVATLNDYVSDPEFRAKVLEPPRLSLLE